MERAPRDPNEKIGPSGFGAQRFVADAGELAYTIFFENQPSAQVPAQEIVITDDLDPDFNFTTIALGEVAFGNQLVDDLRGQASGTVTVPLNGSNNVVVITVANVGDGHVEWRLKAIDPLTGDFPVDDNVGVLPPNDESGRGEGHITFTIRTAGGRVTGTQIANSASIVFDTNAPIVTNTWFNTFDVGAPSSHVTAVVPKPDGAANDWLVTWTGDDNAGGSGLTDYTVFVSDNGGPYAAWQLNTIVTSGTFSALCGHAYDFYSVARDNVGNLEVAPGPPDWTLNSGPDTDSDGVCDLNDNCPANGFQPSTTTCVGTSNGGACDGTDSCNGAGVCVDGFQSATTTCRLSAGQCDVAESCTGSSGACPAEGFQAATTTCVGTSNGGVCDGMDSCNGAGVCNDGYLTATTTCRPSAGQCDVAESCTGSSGACPADVGNTNCTQITPTTTTCSQFATGTALDEVAGSYGTKSNLINSVAPGVIFFYTHITAPAGGVVTFTQSNVGNCGSGWIPMPPQNTAQVNVYSAACGGVSSSSTYNSATGTITTTLTGVTAGTPLIVGIKYTPSSLKGQAVARTCHPTETYTFSGPGGSDSIPFVPRN